VKPQELITARACGIVGQTVGLTGTLIRCALYRETNLMPTVQPTVPGHLQLIDCSSQHIVNSAQVATISVGSAAKSLLVVQGHRGDLVIKASANAGTVCRINMLAGKVTLDSTLTVSGDAAVVRIHGIEVDYEMSEAF